MKRTAKDLNILQQNSLISTKMEEPSKAAVVPDLPLQPVSNWTPICPPSAPQHVAASPATLVSAEDAACLSCS
jgi:hypothetical protein